MLWFCVLDRRINQMPISLLISRLDRIVWRVCLLWGENVRWMWRSKKNPMNHDATTSSAAVRLDLDGSRQKTNSVSDREWKVWFELSRPDWKFWTVGYAWRAIHKSGSGKYQNFKWLFKKYRKGPNLSDTRIIDLMGMDLLKLSLVLAHSESEPEVKSK